MPRVAPHDAAPAVRHGFWAAVVLGALNLLLAGMQPVAGLMAAGVFFGVAWGLRRRHAWAAIAAICCLAPPLLISAAGGHLDRSALSALLVMAGALILLFGRAAASLWAERRNRALWPWAPAAALAAVFWLAFHPYLISGGSMTKTLNKGDFVLVEHLSWTLSRTPEVGDVVMIRYPLDRKQLYAKRVVAGPGDRIHMKDKKLYRNGELVEEPYALHVGGGLDPYRDSFPATPNVQLASAAEEMLQYHVRDGELLVPEGKYFVLGDNRDDSLDSRYWGFLSRRDIVGSPVLVYGPRWPRLVR